MAQLYPVPVPHKIWELLILPLKRHGATAFYCKGWLCLRSYWPGQILKKMIQLREVMIDLHRYLASQVKF